MPCQPWPNHQNGVSPFLADFNRAQLFFLYLPATTAEIGRSIAFPNNTERAITRCLHACKGDARMAKRKAPIIFNTQHHGVTPLRRPLSRLPSRALDFSSTVAPPAPRTLSSTSRTKATAQST